MRCFVLLVFFAITQVSTLAAEKAEKQLKSQIGREVAIERHLADDEEFQIPLSDLVVFGKKLFNANWTEQEGGGRPLTKGTGKPLSDMNSPLVGLRSFNRISAPDANSCAGCHNMPYGISGGGGDFVTNVFVLGQRFDFITFDPKDKIRTRGALNEQMQPVTVENAANLRATTGLFGAGYLEMLARQITHDLQAIRDSLKVGESKPLVSKGISFGRIARGSGGLWDFGCPRFDEDQHDLKWSARSAELSCEALASSEQFDFAARIYKHSFQPAPRHSDNRTLRYRYGPGWGWRGK